MHRNVYLPGRYKLFRGKSTITHSAGIDMLCKEYKSNTLQYVSIKLCRFNSLSKHEGISKMLTNVQFMKEQKQLGIKLSLEIQTNLIILY